jgi:hypothetical protein
MTKRDDVEQGEVDAERAELMQKLRDAVRIEPMAIEEEFVRMPGDLAYWNEQYAQATSRYLRTKAEAARLDGKLRKAARQKLLDANVKPTESQVEAEVVGSVEHEEMTERLIETEVDALRLKGVVDAIRTKRDMLIQVGAHLRAEMERDPAIRERRKANQFAREREADGG